MSLEADLSALLSPIVSGRVYPDIGPSNVQAPYVTYQQVGGQSVNYLSREVPTLRHARMQINVWAATRMQAMQLARAIEDAMRAAAVFTAAPIGAAAAIKDDDDPMRGSMQDFSIWH